MALVVNWIMPEDKQTKKNWSYSLFSDNITFFLLINYVNGENRK